MKRFILFAALVGVALLGVSCKTAPVVVADGLSPAEIVQRAQEASDANRFGDAIVYYQAILDRFPTNMQYVCQADYEIAFIHFKEKKYGQAKDEFDTLLARYDSPDAQLLPAQYKVLSDLIVKEIDEKEAKK